MDLYGPLCYSQFSWISWILLFDCIIFTIPMRIHLIISMIFAIPYVSRGRSLCDLYRPYIFVCSRDGIPPSFFYLCLL